MTTGAPAARADAPIVVLGLGNVLWADEGFGVRCVQVLAQRYAFAAHVTIVDGGTQGLRLLPFVQQAAKLLLFDAVDYALPPGTLCYVEGDDVPRFLGAKKLSLHQTGFQEVLALAQLTATYPEAVLLIGCQPEILDDFGGSLRPCVRAAIDSAIERGVSQLAAWGAPARPLGEHRLQPGDEVFTRRALELERYEAERPSALEACRVGDARFLPRPLLAAEEPNMPAAAVTGEER